MSLLFTLQYTEMNVYKVLFFEHIPLYTVVDKAKQSLNDNILESE
jgi:hypothetical protein